MDNYITLAEVAKNWELSTRRIRKLCEEERVKGAIKFGRNWAIPVSSIKPKDMRIKTGKYVNGGGETNAK